MTLIKTLKNIIEACCGKLDVMEGEINKQNARISSLQEQVEIIKTRQSETTVLLEEILNAVSMEENPNGITVKAGDGENLISSNGDFGSLKPPFGVN